MANKVSDLLKGNFVEAGLEAAGEVKSIFATFSNIFTAEQWNSSLDEFNNIKYADGVDSVLRSVAAGGLNNQLQGFMYGIDRYQRSIMQMNSEHSGLTFITRPRLNLQTTSLRQDRRFAPLDTDSAGMPHAIRCLLDTRYAKSQYGINDPLVNSLSPFLTPVNNGLVGISGFPDPVLQTFTTDTGFYSEDQTFAIGYDDLNKTYDLSLTFKDPQNGPVAATFYYWLLYMHNLTRGIMMAYADDIAQQRMNYTVSIYRFRLDPTRKYITGYAKATGCFPKSIPLGAMFNYGEDDLFAPAVGKFTIPFVANKIEYNDYAILLDFNRLAERYWKDINKVGKYVELSHDGRSNLSGVPYVSTDTETEVATLSRDGTHITPEDHAGGRPRLSFRVKNDKVTTIPEV